MPFLGKNPTAGFASIVKDDLTPDGSTTAFTLSKNVASANDIAVFVGNVRQEPTDAYTASGTSLTMTEAVATGLNFYVLHIAGTVESSVIPADGTISTAKIVTDAITQSLIAAGAVGNTEVASGISASKLTTGTLPAAQVPTGSVVQTVVVSDSSLHTNSSTSSYTELCETTFTPISDSNKILIYAQLGECDIATGRAFARVYYGATANQYSQEFVRICSEYGRGENYEAESHTGNIQVFSTLSDATHNSMSGQRYYGIAIINQVSGTFRIGNGAHHKLIIMEIKA